MKTLLGGVQMILVEKFSRPEPTSHFACGIAAIMKWGKTNGIYVAVFPKQYK